MTATPPTSCKALLKLFLVVAEVVFSTCERICFTRPFDVRDLPAPSMIVVLSLSMTTFLRGEVLKLDILELDAEVFGDGLAAGERSDVFEHGLAAVRQSQEP